MSERNLLMGLSGGLISSIVAALLVLGNTGCDSGKSGGSDSDSDTDSDSDADTDSDSDADGDSDSDSDSDIDTEGMSETEFCNEAGWCWENPTPHGNGIMSLWINGEDDVWMTTDAGQVLRYDGSTWYEWRTPEDYEYFIALWGTGPANMFALASNRLVRWDGNEWTTILNQYSMTDLFGFANDDLWVVGYGFIRHWDGLTWEEWEMASFNFRDVFGVASDDMWVSGYDGVLLHWNGAGWDDHTQTTTTMVNTGIWGPASDDIYFAMTGGSELLHWNGAEIETIDPGLTSSWIDVWGNGADDVWAVGSGPVVARYDGSYWTDVTPDSWGYGFSAIMTHPDEGPWVAGSLGEMCERDGSSWSCSESVTMNTLTSIWGGSADDVDAMGNWGRIATRDSSGWTLCGDDPFYMIWTWQTGEDDAWGYTTDWSEGSIQFYQWDGLVWNERDVDVPTSVNSVWFENGSTGWAVGDGGGVFRFDGTFWSTYSSGTTYNLNDVHGIDASHVWAVGESGSIVFFDGTSWAVQTSGTTDDLAAVWAGAADEAWAAAEWGDMVHYTGGAWTAGYVTGMSEMYDLHGFATDDVWAVGYTGDAWHWNGTDWTEFSTGVSDTLYSVWGAATDDIWAVGEHEALLHWNGTAWSEDTSIADWYWSGVGGTAANDVWIVARYGSMYHYNGSGWASVTNALTEDDVDSRDIFALPSGRLWVVDADGAMYSSDDGDVWSRHGFVEYGDPEVRDVWASSADNAWAVTDGGMILNWDGASWRLYGNAGASRLDAIHGTGPDEAWAVGDALLEFDGTSWTRLDDLSSVSGDYEFVGVYGASGSQVQMLLSSGRLLEWDGTGIESLASMSDYMTYTDAYWVGLDDMWAVGYSGAMLHWDGIGYYRPMRLASNTLTVVSGTPDGDVFAGGYGGIILHKTAD